MEKQPTTPRPNRLAWGSLLVISLGLMGIIAGAFLGARFFIPDNAGLAGGAMVLWYGILGSLVGIAAGAALARWLPRPWLPRSAIACGIGGLAALTFIGVAVSKSAKEQQTARKESLENLLRFEFDLNWSVDHDDRPFDRLVYRSNTNTMTVVGRDRETSTGTLPLETRATLLGILREFDLSGVLREPPNCQQTRPQIGELRLTIYEGMPPNTSGQLKITETCLNEIPELQRLAKEAARLWKTADKS